jgi:carbon monoxide dehydrogenase subunit G
VNLKVCRAVNAPASVVWSIMIDVEGSATAISAIQSIEILSDATEFGVGTRWRETRTMFGKQATETMWISEVDAGTSYVAMVESNGAEYTTIMKVVDTGSNSSEVSMDFSAEPTGTMAKLMGATVGKLFESATRKALAQDLDDIAATAEAQM